MTGESIILVKGISGSGKSTRVYLFLDYLKALGFELVPYLFKTLDGKEKQIGIYSKEFNLIFVGKFYEDGGVCRWQGHDSMTTKLCNSEGLSYFFEQSAKNGYSVLIDGAGTTASWRLRPKDLCVTRGFKNILYIRYDYTEKQLEDYFSRLKYRSGKLPKGDSMWRKRKTFQSDYEKSIEESKDVSHIGGEIVIYNKPFDTPVYDLGAAILNFFELGDLVEDFVNFCKNSSYLKLNSFESFENGKNPKK